jgi:plastocyanin
MPARHRLVAWVLAVALALAFGIMLAPTAPASTGDPTPPPAAGQEQTAAVDLVVFHAVPDRVDIKTGTTVTWTNKEPFDYPLVSGRHQIKADDGSFASPSMAPGTRWSHPFTNPGTFTYHCVLHTGVAGTLVITGDPIIEPVTAEVAITEDKPDDPTTWGFRPGDLVITTGSTVVWRNNGTNTHTVTSADKLFDSGDIAPGASWKYTFDQPGAFAYHCTPHPWMTASIRVVVPGGTPPPPPPAPVGGSPPAHGAREQAASVRQGNGPVRHEVDIVETDPAKPNSWTFDPPTLEVRTGDTVVWRNTGAMSHSITSNDGSFDSAPVTPGATWSRTFDAPAFVAYHCTPHPWMKGVVRVAAPDAPPPPPPAGFGIAATSGFARSKTPEPARQGSGPVTRTVDIVEPNMADAMAWGFDPKTLDIRAGDTVTWHNTGTLQHSVTSDGFDSGLAAGMSWSKTFGTPGVYPYHCTPHPLMKGVIRVTNGEGGEPPPLPQFTAAGGPGEQAAGPLPTQTQGGTATLAAGGRGLGGDDGQFVWMPFVVVVLFIFSALAWAGFGSPPVNTGP